MLEGKYSDHFAGLLGCPRREERNFSGKGRDGALIAIIFGILFESRCIAHINEGAWMVVGSVMVPDITVPLVVEMVLYEEQVAEDKFVERA
jgi:hypothetical protein